MNTINNNKISLVINLLATLTLAVVSMSSVANAQSVPNGSIQINGYHAPEIYTPTYSYYNVAVPVYVPTPVATNSPTPTVYSSATNPNALASSKIAKAKTAETSEEPEETATSLTANAIFGSPGFLPSNLIEWIFFAVLVGGVVLLVRTIYGGREKYNATPMKHK